MNGNGINDYEGDERPAPTSLSYTMPLKTCDLCGKSSTWPECVVIQGKTMCGSCAMTYSSPKLGIGDVNSDAKGSGARYNADKPDMSLIPLFTLEDEARVWEYGKKKYAAFNWMKGMPWSVPFACIQRHLAAWQRGEERDSESGLPHLAHVMCNMRMLTLYARTYPEGDDRPPKELLK